jgi:hypothetical protein
MCPNTPVTKELPYSLYSKRYFRKMDFETYHNNLINIAMRRMASAGMLRRVALVRTEVSEEISVSIIKVTRIGELGTTLAVTSNRHLLRRNIKYFFAACFGC